MSPVAVARAEHVGPRIVLRFDAPDASTILGTLSGLLGGGAAAKWLEEWGKRKGNREQSEMTLEARVIGWTDEVQQRLTDQVREQGALLRESMERAHSAEKSLAVAEYEREQLRNRLAGKDEKCKAAVGERDRLRVELERLRAAIVRHRCNDADEHLVEILAERGGE